MDGQHSRRDRQAQARPRRPPQKNKKPAAPARRTRGLEKIAKTYLANTTLAVCDLARAAAFLCTTPDLVALSIAEA